MSIFSRVFWKIHRLFLLSVFFDLCNCKGITALVFRMTGMAFDPDPFYSMDIQQSEQLLPQIHIQSWSAFAALPVVLFPVVYPAFGDGIDQIFGITGQCNAAGAL